MGGLSGSVGSPKILFLGGLSGAGKSRFARYLQLQHGWLWIEIDQRGCDGINLHDLRAPWNAFQEPDGVPRDPGPLRRELLRRAATNSHDRIVLSFSSRMLFDEEQMEISEGVFHFAYLYGDPGRCLQAFLDRERERRSQYGSDVAGMEYWFANNWGAICFLNGTRNHPLIIPAFAPDGSRRGLESIYEDVLSIIGDRV